MKQTKSPYLSSSIYFYIGILLAIVVVNGIFLLLLRNDTTTISLLKKELTILEQDQKIITTSDEIAKKYENEVAILSQVFPTEETMPQFIQTLEGMIQKSSSEYSFQFNSSTPLPEQDKLFVLLTVTMMSDARQLIDFFQALEALPYMTHVTAVSAKMPAGFEGKGEYSIGVKVYVQNPFTTK